ncbi:MAG: hypothetical protein HQ592_01655 [Planctomycetes bacterium]|nr:hypothetical protein [Planctomycetota bacterium]
MKPIQSDLVAFAVVSSDRLTPEGLVRSVVLGLSDRLVALMPCCIPQQANVENITECLNEVISLDLARTVAAKSPPHRAFN